MKTEQEPLRLCIQAAPGSALRRGLEAAQGRGPTEEQVQDLERRLLAALGAAGAITAVAATKAGATAGTAAAATAQLAPAAAWLPAGAAAKVAVGLSVAALLSGGAVGVWRVTSVSRRPSAMAAPAPVTAAPRRGSAGTAPPAKLAPDPTASPPGPTAPPVGPTAPPPIVRATPATPGGPSGAIPPARAMARVARAPASARAAVLQDRAPGPTTAAGLVGTGAAPAPTEPPATEAPSAMPARDDDDELRLLARAHRVLSSDPALALALAAEHGRRFPAGAMDQEREMIAVTALVGLGRIAEARLRAEGFARDHAGSAYIDRIRSVVGQRGRRP